MPQALDDDGNGLITEKEFEETLADEPVLMQCFWDMLPRPDPPSLQAFTEIRVEVRRLAS